MAKKKEERRRGKKRKNVDGGNEVDIEEAAPFIVDLEGDREGREEQGQDGELVTPSWMIEKAAASSTYSQIEAAAPFGLVDVDLKAYLRTAHIKLQELMETAAEEGRPVPQDEEVRIMRNAMLDEIKGKELTLATDTDTSLILEDLLRSFSERQCRILADSLTVNESLFKLSCHRFGSHLLQSTLVALQAVASQEEREQRKGKSKSSKVVDRSGQELRSAQQLVLDISTALNAHLSQMISDQFSTHVLRTLLLILSGQSTSAMDSRHRSKKSRMFQKKNQAVQAGKEETVATPVIPASFRHSLATILATLSASLEPSKVKSLSRDAIAGPTLALVLELVLSEKDDATAAQSSLSDAVFDGLVSTATSDRSDYVEDLIKDSVGSHLLQRLMPLLDRQTVHRFWEVYVKGRLAKLGTHPLANFVIAAVIKSLDEDDDAFGQACKEIELVGEGLIKNQRIGVLIALADRAQTISHLHPVKAVAPNEVRKKQAVKSVWVDDSVQSRASRAILRAFGFDGDAATEAEEEHGLLIKVLASGKTRKGYQKELKRAKEAKANERKTANEALEEEQQQQHNKVEDDGVLISMQGSLLCQSLLRLREPGNAPLLASILQMPSLLPLVSNPTTVHIVLASFQPNADCSFSQRNALSAKILEDLPTILSDKFGSRVIDCLFDSSDAFYKEKIMRKCLESERAVLASNFGRYFLKRTNIALFRKDVGQWKRWVKERESQVRQAEEDKAGAAAAQPHPAKDGTEQKTKKRRKVDEELDNILADL